LAFIGGKGPPFDADFSLLPPFKRVFGADSGVQKALCLGFSVDFAIGDFDSLDDLSVLKKIEHIKLPREKDITDTEALLDLLTKQQFDSYVLLGGGEGRFDHLIHLYSLFARYMPPLLWMTDQEIIYLAKNTFFLDSHLGRTISFLPATLAGSSVVSSTGLQWELNSYPISATSHSISNTIVDQRMKLVVQGAPVFVSLPFK